MAIAGIGTAIASIVGAGASVASNVHSANVQSDSATRAANMQAASNAMAMEQQKAQDAQQKAEFDSQQAELKRQWDATQAFNANVYNTKEARLAPYRAASTQALGRLGDLLGMHFDTSAPPPTTYQTQPFNPNATTTPAVTTPPTATGAPAAAAPMSMAPAMPPPMSTVPTGANAAPSYTPVIPFSQLYQTQRNLAVRPQ